LAGSGGKYKVVSHLRHPQLAVAMQLQVTKQRNTDPALFLP
jgi:hypothetical protein